MAQVIVVDGRYAGHTFIPDESLPDVEGKAQLIITTSPVAPASIFDLFGKAPRQRSEADIAAQVEAEHQAWGEP